MPQTHHVERHFTAGDTVRDIVIGMSDGLTVPFALAAGLSSAASSTSIIITAGLAEVAAGAIAMGLGGYLAAKSDFEHYKSEHQREWREVKEIPDAERREVKEVFSQYGLSDQEIAPILTAFQARPEQWVNFMMRFELGLEKPEPSRAYRSAVTIGSAYVLGGLIPLSPYFFYRSSHDALIVSVAVTLVALAIFGYFKGYACGNQPFKSAFQTVIIGGVAAGAAFSIAALVR
ncbi:MAG TPA: VIT1/CCC1 transporter family protein [Oculatellaceae cyanobacterium]